MKDLLNLPNVISQKDEKPHTAGLNDSAILHVKIKITEIQLEKSSTLQYHKPPCLPHRPNPGMSQMLLLIKLDCFLAFFIALQRAKKVVSDSTGLVDFAMWPENSVLDLPDGQLTFLGEFINNFFRAR